MFPEIRKKLSSFLLCEDGKISKNSLLTLGSAISAVIIGGVLASKYAAAVHNNVLSTTASQQQALAQHGHHVSSIVGDCGNDCFAACTACGPASPCGPCGVGSS